VEERELEVRRELHALKLAGAATVLRRGGAIDVQLAPTSVEQEQRLKIALENIPDVSVSVLSAQEAVLHAIPIGSQPIGAPATERLAEPLASKWLRESLASDSEVHAEEVRRTEAAQRLVSLVAEWRLLADRYPIADESQLSVEARAILNGIVDDLRTQIRREVDNERAAIALLSRGTPAAPGTMASERSCGTWQSQAVTAADLLWENEQATEQFYAPVPSGGAAVSDADHLSKLGSLTETLNALPRVSCDSK
jgi:hypothetical protein